MVLANGFITTDRQTALQQLIEQKRGHDCNSDVMPLFCSMTYFISDIGEVYGCQLLRNICLTKPIKIERRYSKGCSIRYSTSPKHQANAYMQYIMYATFVTRQWDDTLQLEPIDGNTYNYRLDNIRVKDERADVFYTNLYDSERAFEDGWEESEKNMTDKFIDWLYQQLNDGGIEAGNIEALIENLKGKYEPQNI